MKSKKIIVCSIIALLILAITNISKAMMIDLDISGEFFLKPNETTQLKATYIVGNDIVIPGEENNGLYTNEMDVTKECKWTSSNESVATIDQNGLVTAHTYGTTEITADYQNGRLTEKYDVTVIGEPSGVELESISFKDENMYKAMLKEIRKYITNKDDETRTIKMTKEKINNVESLDLGNSSIEDISGIENFTNIKELNITRNDINDLSKLSSLNKIENIYFDFNKIGDINVIKNVKNISCSGQNIEIVEKEQKRINLPSLFTEAQNKDSKFYANNRIKLFNCSLSEDGKQIILNDNVKIASIVLVDGIASGSAFVVKTEDPQYSENEIRTIHFDDPNFYNAIIEDFKAVIISKNDQEQTINILQKNLENIDTIYMVGENIENISGIENFTNLRYVILTKNRISNIEKLKDLYRLEWLDLSNNKVSNLEPLKGLINLDWLELDDNEISDISPIGGLKYLDILYLQDNKIKDISCLGNLKELRNIMLQNNNIEDVSAIDKRKDNLFISVTDQTIEKVIQNNEKITLPQIFISAKNTESQMYTERDFTFINCELSADGKEVIIKNNASAAVILINGGQLNGSKLVIKASENETVAFFNDENLYKEIVRLYKDKIMYNEDNSKIVVMSNENINSITKIDIQDKSIVDIAGLEAFKNLEELILKNNNITSVYNLNNLQKLKKLDLSYNTIDPTGLQVNSLVELNLEGQKGATFLWYYDQLIGMDNVKKLNISSNGIKYITPILNFKNLEELDISSNSLEDISKLSELKKLTNVTANKQTINVYTTENTVELPQIFIEAQNSRSVYYSNSGLTFEHCALSGDKKSVIIEDNVENAKVIIKEGKLASSTLNITCENIIPIDETLIVFKDQKLYTAMCEILGNKIKKKDDENYTINVDTEDIASVTTLNLSQKEIKNITGLEKFTNLTELKLNNISKNGGTYISDIGPIANLTKLQKLDLSGNQINNVNYLEQLVNLTELDLSSTYISNISVLSNLKKLTKLNLSYNQVVDITPLAELTELKELNVSSESQVNWPGLATKLTDITSLANLTKLEDLDISGNRITSLKDISNLTKLKKLDASSNRIEDIKDLAKLTNLKSLDMSLNTIRDISVLAGLTKLETINFNYQTISDVVETKEIEAPEIFKEAMNKQGIGYTSSEMTCSNCTISKNGIITIKGSNEEAYIQINGGILDGSIYNITYYNENGLSVNFSNYEVSSDGDIKYVLEIQPNTTVDQIKAVIETNGTISIQANNETHSVISTGKVATGNKIVITKGEETKEFIIVVKGDTDGDSDVDFKDILKVNKHRLNKKKLTGAFEKASDVNKSNSVDFKDILRMNKFRLGKIKTL